MRFIEFIKESAEKKSGTFDPDSLPNQMDSANMPQTDQELDGAGKKKKRKKKDGGWVVPAVGLLKYLQHMNKVQ
jgi:hypothetical protein